MTFDFKKFAKVHDEMLEAASDVRDVTSRLEATMPIMLALIEADLFAIAAILASKGGDS